MKRWGGWLFWVQVGSQSSRWSGQPIHAVYIRELWGHNSIISSGCLCSCGTIQPPQVAVLINSAWAGVKPLLGAPAHIWKHCHLHGLPWQLRLWRVWFSWYLFYLRQSHELIDSLVFVIPVACKDRGLFECCEAALKGSKLKGTWAPAAHLLYSLFPSSYIQRNEGGVEY